MSKIKNIIILVAVGGTLILVYVFFIKKSPDPGSLVVSSPLVSTNPDTNNLDANSIIAGDFLSLLLNVKNIRLNDAILSDIAFTSLHDSSITLTPDGSEGRANPFAPLGSDSATLTNTNSTVPLGAGGN